MSEYSNIIQGSFAAAPARAVSAVDEDPDVAARSIDLASATGVPATAIAGDLEGFERQHKAQLAGDIVRQNPQLADYINSHPLAASISNDDYGNLDSVSEKATALAQLRRLQAPKVMGIPTEIGERALGEGWQKLKEGWGTPGQWMTDEEVKNYQFLGALGLTGELPIRALNALMQGALGVVHGGASATYEAAGGTPSEAERFSRDITGAAEMQMIGGGVHSFKSPSPKLIEGITAAKPWLEHGMEPPKGIHPEIDRMKAEANVRDLKTLDEALAESQASTTRERNPDMFAGFVRQHLGETKIGIGGDRIAELYGDKVPTADDGLLGWVPGIKNQLEAARATGADVQIPIADWLAKVDPKVAKDLHDDIRVQPGNITAREVELEKAVEAEKQPIQATPEKTLDQRYADLDAEKASMMDKSGTEDELFSSIETASGLGFGDRPKLERAIQWAINNGRPDIAETIMLRTEHEAARQSETKPGVDPANAERYARIENQLKDIAANTQAMAIDFRAKYGKPEGISNPRVVDAPIAQTRAASSLEPLYSIGDRKLQLQRFGEPVKGYENFHDFQLMDQEGHPVGVLNLSIQGKQVYVEGIEGLGGLGPRDFGPSLMRDILRQIKAEFPEAESITGHRVSGARDKAGTYNDPRYQSPVVKLDVMDDVGIQKFQEALQEQQWEQYSSTLIAKPVEYMNAKEHELVTAVETELRRIVPKQVEFEPVSEIKIKGLKGRTAGAYLQYTGENPLILYSLTAPDTLGTARHEAIHHLRNYGFFNEGEWNTLSEAAKSEGWMDRYRINQRYKDLPEETRLEESIAEAYRDWKANKDNLVNRAMDAIRGESAVAKIFRKLDELMETLKTKFREIMGHEPTAEELFGKVDIGEIGAREGTQPLNPAAYRERLSIGEERQDMLRANATGLDLKSFKAIQKLIEQRHAEDIAATIKRVEREQAQRQTKEWKDNRKELRAEIDDQIRNRPDVAADLFFGSGELYGKKLARGYRIRTEDLTPEQQAALPKHYQAKDGIPADEAAKLFGYGSGDAMVGKLIEYNQAKGKVPAQEFLKTVVDAETDRQMEAKYGFLEKNIMEDAKDQVLSETQLNILAEEMHAVGMQAGVKTIDKNVATAWVKDRFGKLSIGDVKSDGFLRDVGRHGRDAERMLIGGDPATALVSLQKKYLSALFANEAKKLETQVERFDRDAKRMSKREVPSMEPEYLNFIHQIFTQIGKPIRRSIQDLAEQIEASGHKNLEEFVESKEASLRELPVADFLYDTGWRKPYESLSVEEFRAISDSVKALAHNARDELKIYRAGEAADFVEKKAEMMEQLEQFQLKHYDTKGKRWLGPIPPKIASGIRTYIASHMQMEGLFNRWDKFDPRGVWNQYVMRDLVEGANQEAAWRTEFSKKLGIIKDGADLNKAVNNPIFKDPLGGGLMNFTRKNLRTIMLNAGNESNMTKLAKGYGLEPKQVWDWINIHATKEDWEWAQKIGDIFGEIKGKSDTMYRSLTGGVAPEGIDIKPFDTPHGKQAGWYYPIIFHPEFEGKSKRLMGGDPLEGEGYIRATTPAGYTKGRTGYVAPLALDLDALPGRMASMLHDVAMRPAVLNAAKVMYDKDIRTQIAARYGTEYRDLMVPYLRDVANSANYNSKAQKMFTQASEFIRQNMISTLVGLNPGTVMKHGPTALVQSIMEVGPKEFLQATKSLFSINEATGESNWKFAMETSQELQRRHRNYRETLSGATEELVPTSAFQSLRQTVLNVSSLPVSMSDLLSAVPTWLAQYTKSMADNGGIHGDAIFDADRAVRRAHGSTAITNRPVVMRGGTLSQWFASVYGFFNHIMNRQAELVWKTGDAFGLVKDGEYKEAMSKVPGISAMLFAYVLAPALIEEMVTPLASTDNESWGKKAAKGVGFTLGASWVGIRDIASATLNGRDPSAGLISTAYQQVSNLARDWGKKQPMNKEHAGKLLQDSVSVFGTATGLMPAQVGRTARFGYGVAAGTERPKGPWGWLVGMRYGTLDKHSKTFEEWRKHH